MARNTPNRLRRDDLVKVVAIGTILGAIAGLAGAPLGIPSNLAISIAAGTTGVIAAVLVAHSNSRSDWLLLADSGPWNS